MVLGMNRWDGHALRIGIGPGTGETFHVDFMIHEGLFPFALAVSYGLLLGLSVYTFFFAYEFYMSRQSESLWRSRDIIEHWRNAGGDCAQI